MEREAHAVGVREKKGCKQKMRGCGKSEGRERRGNERVRQTARERDEERWKRW